MHGRAAWRGSIGNGSRENGAAGRLARDFDLGEARELRVGLWEEGVRRILIIDTCT